MKMEVMEKVSDVLSERILVKTLSSGTKCYIIPKAGYLEKQAAICVDFGSIDIENTDGSVPLGTAHFLEHKLFEEEWGDAFSKFSELGADANAFTDFNKTAYYFSCTENFEDNFSLLLSFVQNPYFPEESTQREKGIIGQEITMYDDDPNWVVFFNLLKGMYHNHTVKYGIAGSIESIEKIHGDTLLKCYEAFYTPENMAIVCVGDFDSDKVFEQADKLMKKSKTQGQKAVQKKEPSTIYQNAMVKNMDVSIPLFHIGFKIEPTEESYSAKRICAMRILFDLLAGNSSDFYNWAYDNNIVEEEIGFEYLFGDGYAAAVLSGSSMWPEQVAEGLLGQIEQKKDHGISKEEFDRLKKKHKSRFLRGFNSIDAICMSQIDLAIKNTDMIEMNQALCELEIKDIEEVLQECFQPDKLVLSIVRK